MSAGRWVRRVRIGAAVLWLLAALPLWFALSIACEDHFGDRGFVHVALITEQTCAELAKTDPIFADLPDGVAVTAVYLRQMPGEAEATVSLTADDPEAFAQWLATQQKPVQRREDGTFALAYLIRDGRHNFGDTAGSGVQRWVNGIFWPGAAVIFVLLCLPWDKGFCKKDRKKPDQNG